jgi:hypothetical protein
LTPERRRQFLQTAAKWQEALVHWQDRPSLSFALMVIACEALKPPDADDRLNGSHVVEALLGESTANKLRQQPFPVQWVRSTHLHTGEFHGAELVPMVFISSYEDPSFREAHSTLFKVTAAAIIEWLKRGGRFEMPGVKQRKTIRRWLKDNVFVLLAVALGIGGVIGWLLRTVWQN